MHGTFHVFHKIHIRGATPTDRLTEDDIPELTKKFSQWGEVVFIQVHTRIFKSTERLNRPYGFVTFKDKKSVVSCLQDSAIGVTLDDGRLVMPRQAVFNIRPRNKSYHKPTEAPQEKITAKCETVTNIPMDTEIEDERSINGDSVKSEKDISTGQTESELEMQLLSETTNE